MSTLTKDAIKKSFMKLLNTKQLNKITVKEIVEDCGINRNSFYYHYDDILSLLEEIFNEQADNLIQLNSDASIYECLLSTVDYALKNKNAMMHIYNSANREMFDTYFRRVSQRTVSEYINAVSSEYNISNRDRELIITYYKNLLTGYIFDWLGSGMKYDLADDLKRVCELFEGSTERILEKAAEKNEEEKA